MTQEQKNLLLKDLCARLFYGVKVQCLSHQNPLKILSINPNGVTWVTGDKGYPFEVDWKDCKPYLFPLSSMTKKQMDQFNKTLIGIENFGWSFETFDWVNKNHFDYRGLIEKGLAIDATGLNIY